MKNLCFYLRTLGALCVALLFLAAGAPDAGAQATANPPGKLTYQGFLTDVNGVPLGNTQPINTNVVFRIHTASSGGTLKWAEQQTVTIDKGHFSVLLGEGSQNASEPFSASLTSIFGGSDASDRYMEITVGTTTIAPRMQFLPAPYALLAANARGVVDAAGNPLITPTGIATSLTSLNATSISTGTLADGRLSPNVALKAGGNAFTGNQTVISGNVGIGTASPGSRLTVSEDGSQSISIVGTGNNGNPAEIIFDKTAAGSSHKSASGYANGRGHFIWVNGSDRLNINASGNVGIGTTSPGSSLEVAGGIRARGGAPGASGSLNNGYAFSGNNGDNDTGMFSLADGQLLFYSDSIERFRINTGGNIGIGTISPNAPLHVAGAVNHSFTLEAVMDPYGAGDVAASPRTLPHGIVADSRIKAAAFDVDSDKRIKNILGVSDATKDLDTLLHIQITDYTYKDFVNHGRGGQKKVIAQQVEEVFPQAVAKSIGTVPDIFKKAGWEAGWVKLATDLKVGERVRLLAGNQDGVHEVLEVREDAFRTALNSNATNLFVYGREVKDFRSVDYDAIAMLNVSATQELARKLEAKDAEIAALKQLLAELETRAQAGEGRLASLEKLLRGLTAAKTPSTTRPSGEE